MAWDIHVEILCILLECVSNCEHGIACALRWGVALVGDFLYWDLSPCHGKTNFFQVLEVHWAMRLTSDLSCDEKGSKCVVLYFVQFWVERPIFYNFMN